MRMQKICLTLILGGLAFGVGAQGTSTQSGGGGGPQGGGQSSQQGGPQRGPQGEHGGPRRPPPQAIDACQGKSSGAACSFTGREGQARTGTCFAPPAQQDAGGKGAPPLACRPARNGQGGGEGGQGGQGRQGGAGQGSTGR